MNQKYDYDKMIESEIAIELWIGFIPYVLAITVLVLSFYQMPL